MHQRRKLIMTKSNLPKVVCVLALGLGGVFAGVALKIQNDPFAFTTPKNVTNVTLEVKPEKKAVKVTAVEEDLRVVELEPLVIKAKPKNMGAAYPKKAAKKPCKLTYRVVGFTSDKFDTFRGVYSCDPVE